MPCCWVQPSKNAFALSRGGGVLSSSVLTSFCGKDLRQAVQVSGGYCRGAAKAAPAARLHDPWMQLRAGRAGVVGTASLDLQPRKTCSMPRAGSPRYEAFRPPSPTSCCCLRTFLFEHESPFGAERCPSPDAYVPHPEPSKLSQIKLANLTAIPNQDGPDPS